MSDLEQAHAKLRARQGSDVRYDADAAPARALQMARRGFAYMARLVNGLDEAALWRDSARPGWTRRRVIAVNALQAHEIAQALEGGTGQQGDRAATGAPRLIWPRHCPPARCAIWPAVRITT